jgi:hypothetical protein
MADAFTAKLDTGLVGQYCGEFATTPLRIERAMLQGVLLDEALKVHFEGTSYFGRAAGARAVDEALSTFMGKAMNPFTEGGIGKRECVGDRLQASAFDDFTDRLGAPKDAGLFCALQHGIQS